MTLAGPGADVIRDRVAADLRSGTGPGMSALVDAMSVASRRVLGAAR